MQVNSAGELIKIFQVRCRGQFFGRQEEGAGFKFAAAEDGDDNGSGFFSILGDRHSGIEAPQGGIPQKTIQPCESF